MSNEAPGKERPVRMTACISPVCHMPMTIFKTDDEVAAPGRTLQCTELMAEFINECEWKHDVIGIIKKKWFATSNLILTSLLMEEMRPKHTNQHQAN